MTPPDPRTAIAQIIANRTDDMWGGEGDNVSVYDSHLKIADSILAALPGLGFVRQEWRPVSDALYGRCLICIDFCNPQIPDGRHVTFACWNGEQWIDDDGNDILSGTGYKILGWMPERPPLIQPL